MYRILITSCSAVEGEWLLLYIEFIMGEKSEKERRGEREKSYKIFIIKLFFYMFIMFINVSCQIRFNELYFCKLQLLIGSIEI